MELQTLSRWEWGAIVASVFAIAAATPRVAEAACAKSDPTFEFELPGGNPEATFVAAHQQAHVDIGYESAADLSGIQLRPVSGRLTLCDALNRMFAGTGLAYELTGPHSIRVHRIGPGAVGGLPASQDVRRSEGSGTAALEPARDAEVASSTAVSEVVITGSFIRGVQDVSSPLIVLRDNQLKQTPYATVEDAIRTLPLTSRAGPNEQYDPTGSGGNFNRGESINLRGLGAGATLVLVDGHRQPSSGYYGDFVDVSNIPWSVVERIEVLPDGASALYGSDAIAGVVNVVLRNDFQGAETQAKVGIARDGAQETLLSQMVGTHWEGGKVLLAYQFDHRSALDAADRSYSASDDKRPFGGTDLRSIWSNPGNILDPATGLPIAAIPAGQSGNPLSASQLVYGSSNLQNRLTGVQLLPDRRTHSVYWTASEKATDWMELFAEARFAQREIWQVFPAADFALEVPPSNPFLIGKQNPQQPVLVGYSFLDDFGPRASSGRTRNYGGSFGASFTLSDSWKATLTSTYARETLHWMDGGEFNYDALNAALANPDPAYAFNPFGDGSHTNPMTLNAIQTAEYIDSTSGVVDTSLVGDGRVLSLPAGDAKLAIGAAYRREGLTHTLPASGRFDRTVSSIFAQIAVPLAGPADSRGPPRLSLSLAARGEYYSDFGATKDPRVGLQWAPSQQLKMRASWGTSFRAPKLVDLYDTSQDAVAVIPVADSHVPQGHSFVVLEQGVNNPNLREERASTWTVGIDLVPRPVPGFSASLTYYSIDYKNQVFQPAPPLTLEGILSDPQWAPLVTRNPSEAELASLCNSPKFLGPSCAVSPPSVIIDARPLNLSRTRMRGIDAQFAQVLDLRYGELAMRLDAAYVLQMDLDVTGTGPDANLLNTVGYPLSHRLRATIDWALRGANRPGLGASVALDYSGGYRDTSAVPTMRVRSYAGVDASLRYRTASGSGLWDDSEVVLTVANVFNRDPPFANVEIGYDTANSQPLGRVLGVYVRKAW
jgi:iron complex outermembrane recepter protein